MKLLEAARGLGRVHAQLQANFSKALRLNFLIYKLIEIPSFQSAKGAVHLSNPITISASILCSIFLFPRTE
jgi:hypothetical protein